MQLTTPLDKLLPCASILPHPAHLVHAGADKNNLLPPVTNAWHKVRENDLRSV